MKTEDLRQNYNKGKLEEKYLPNEPYQLFNRWFEELTKSDNTFLTMLKRTAGKILVGESIEPNAMTLSTVDMNGNPNSRTVLMKGYGDMWIEFFTNYESDKGKEIKHNPNVSLTFWWSELQRQVIIRGKAERVHRFRTEKYFATRPKKSKLGAIASSQSEIIPSREVLEEKYKQVEEEYKHVGDHRIKPPEKWGGYKVRANTIEFWQGRVGRLHDRIRYINENGEWRWVRVSP